MSERGERTIGLSSWQRGRDEILTLLDQGELTQVMADLDLAQRLLTAARRHVKSAETLCDNDPELADFLVRFLAEQLDIKYSAGTSYQADGMRLSRTPSHFPGVGREKLHIAETLLAPALLEWEDSFALGDSMGDAAVLSNVGIPVAFAPKGDLLPLAHERGWAITNRDAALRDIRQLLTSTKPEWGGRSIRRRQL